MTVKIAGYVLLLLVWTIVKVKSLRSQQKNKEAVVYGCILVSSALVGSILLARVNLPSFTEPARMLLEPIGKMLLKQ
ncbi:hypothetical protein [Paenibacillus lignilyticus]|uniref:Uncharacterized protein n=1 Tax=Paenibacillus lignilyticus TaxID=1172615 RepID=A0ABS5CB92_9BACL|nr:hypothetical protein [Paenibacillus lignilyticus]MBP3963213.1 hypothetical protein [Paenibacillus lignilyticus]